MVLGIYHININVSSLEHSQAFYEMLGFRVVETFAEKGNENLDRGLGLPYTDTRAVFMKLGNGNHETLLDLVEWIEPKSEGQVPKLTNLGIQRIALRVKNLDNEVQRLKDKGVDFFSPPQIIDTLVRKPRFACFKDPDGVVLEMVEF